MTKLKPIGIIHSPYKNREGMPIQPTGAAGASGTIEVFDEYRAGLKDLDGFSHIILLYLFHLSEGFKLEVVPSWTLLQEASLQHELRDVQIISAYLWFDWTGLRMD